MKEGLYMNINIGLFTIIKNYGVIKNIVANLLPIFYYKERLYINVFIIILYIFKIILIYLKVFCKYFITIRQLYFIKTVDKWNFVWYNINVIKRKKEFICQ